MHIFKELGVSLVKASRNLGLSALIILALMDFSAAAEPQQRIVVLGDSLTSGYGLQGGEDFPSKLQDALIQDGLNVRVDNAGVSGDTTAGGVSRVEWSVAGDPKPALVIVALGGNDMLRGLEPDVTRTNLTKILTTLKEKEIPVLLAGMKAPLQYTLMFQKSFDSIYSDLAEEFDVPLYPFFLEGVALKPEMNQSDGIHPNQAGVARMVEGLLPLVKEQLDP